MSLADLPTAVLAGLLPWVLVVIVLRVWGYRVDIKLKPVNRRRRRPIEPDEHSAFL